MNAALIEHSEMTKVANEVLYLRSILEELKAERSNYAWLWEIRLKTIDYIVRRYDLESLADPEMLWEYQKQDLRSSSFLLQIPSSAEPQVESESVRNLRRRIRSLFESVKQRSDLE